MPLKHFTHDFNPRPPDPYAKNRLFKAAEELGYVVVTRQDLDHLRVLTKGVGKRYVAEALATILDDIDERNQ